MVGLLLGNVLLRLNNLRSDKTWKKAVWWFSLLVFHVLFIGIILINIGYGSNFFAESFQKIDIDKDGLITGYELRSTVTDIGYWEVNSIIDEADLDGGGTINFKEWTAYMASEIYNKKFISTS